ncbi:homeodomain-only protein isoform X2 [Castor canadensis]
MSAETASGPTEDQVEILEYNFNKVNKHPDPTTLCLIAAEAGLSEEETQLDIFSQPPGCLHKLYLLMFRLFHSPSHNVLGLLCVLIHFCC